MGFNAEQKNVYDLFNRKSYRIPRNQRRYVWEKRNWEELFDDISTVVDKSFQPHFIGSFVLKDEGRKGGLPQYTIIDGQQRVMTLTILLASILFWLRKEKLFDDYEGTKQYVMALDDKARTAVMVQSDYHLSLESIIKTIIEMDDEQFYKTSVNSFLEIAKYGKTRDQNIINAFKYFISTIKEHMDYVDDRQKYLVALRDATVGISYISIISSSEEDSYTIFEILNARGTILEDHELLKNYIMRYIQPEENRDVAKQVWATVEDDLGKNLKKFVKHYATHKCGFNKTEGLSEYKLIQRAYKGNDTDSLLKDLRMKADYYNKMLNPLTICPSESVECRVFSFFRKKRQEQLRPVLLSLMHQNAIGALPNDKYEDVLVFIYNFYVCYNIIGEENSNKLTNVVYKYAEKIENQYSSELLTEFISELKRKLPSRDVFENAFKNVGWSHHKGFYEGDKNKERTQTVLEVLERYLNNGKCLQDFSIEHVYDDALTNNAGQIGNIIPLEETLNNGLSGKEYKEKVLKYSESNYMTARLFSKRYTNTEFKPGDRTKYLAKLFYDDILKLSSFE